MESSKNQNGQQDFFSEIKSTDDTYKYYCQKWLTSESNKTVPIYNPTTNKVQYYMQACSQKEVDNIYEVAEKVQKTWAKTALWKRAELLHKAAEYLRNNAQPIADALVKEIAKSAKDSVTEVIRSADLIDYTAEEGVRVLGEGKMLTSDSFPGNERNKICLESKIPLGVVLCIPPFNYPVNLAVSKISPALMCGNAIVLKPPTQGAIGATHMIQCFHKAGFPEGLVNLVTGRGSEIGDYLTTHDKVNCISFTGGDTGIAISKKVGMIPLQMELGGKDVAIVCSDADMKLVTSSIIKGAFSYSGQRCTAIKIVIVEESVADEVISGVVDSTKKLTVGTPEDNSFITPVISKTSADFIEGLVKDAEQKGAKLEMEYKREDNLIYPLVISNVTDDMRLAWEEPFGPVLPIKIVKDIEDAVIHCNKSRFGLQGCVFSKNIDKAMKLADAMETGTVQINGPPARGPDHFPFQGIRNSGIGSQGIKNSLDMMSKIKSTVINLDSPSYTVG